MGKYYQVDNAEFPTLNLRSSEIKKPPQSVSESVLSIHMPLLLIT